MSYRGKAILAVVPARGGSKGIPRKNLQCVGGKTLIGRAADLVSSLDWIDKGIISTDDPEMAEEGTRHGLDAPFLRPAELASDFATAIDAWKHAWLAAESTCGLYFDISLYLEPTSPCRRAADLTRTLDVLLDGDHWAGATVSRTPSSHTPHKTLLMDDTGCIQFYLENGADFSIRQKIPAYYHRNGICYAVRRETLLAHSSIIEHQCAAVVIDRPVVNIDEPWDLELAEFLLSKEE
jgi:CMP-N,N'-diacetyllegionaminic acid synthase